jgi:broad specificity phosphatase PhoE
MPSLPQIYLVRHGETEWTISGQHTGRTNILLTKNGEDNAKLLAKRLEKLTFSKVYTSPLLRAKRTCELAGFGSIAEDDPDLMEWNYGQFEGLTSAQIRQSHPNWQPFSDGYPGGETVDQIGERAQRVVAHLRKNVSGNILIFSHGHFLRFIAGCWLGLPFIDAHFFLVAPTSLSILGYEHNMNESCIRLWNDTSHLN